MIRQKIYILLLLMPFIFCCCTNNTIKPTDYTKETKKIPPSFGDKTTILVFLVESNLENTKWKSKVIRDNKRQINNVVPLYYKGQYEIIESRNEFYKYEDRTLYRYILHFKTFFPSKNGRTGEYSRNYGDDTYQIFIEDMATGLHYEASVKTLDYEGLLKVYAEYLEKERNKAK